MIIFTGSGSTLKNDLDNTVDPCNDFYSFTCGKFIKNEKLPEKLNSYNRHLRDTWDIRDKLKSSLKKNIANDDSETVKKLKMFFKMCEKGGNVSLLSTSNQN